MIQTSAVFAALIDTAPSRLHLTLDNGTQIPTAAVKSAEWSGGSNAGDDITLGSTVAAQLKAVLDRAELGAIALADARLTAALTLEGADDQVPWGVLQVDDVDSDDDTVTITACDAMIWAFNTAYALDDAALGFDWAAGVDGETLLRAICAACGVALGTVGLPPITLTLVDATGYTYREVIAFLACMWGRFARMDGQGRLVLQWYAAADRPISAARYYEGELTKADYPYTVGYLKCYVEPLEETLEIGDTASAQGIYIKCPWMTPECLAAVWAAVGGFSYRPVSGLRCLGDPRLEPGDVVQVTDLDGTVHTVPCMTLRHEFDGGLISEITAVGKSVSASEQDYQGPVTREIERAVQNVKVSLIKYQDRIEAAVEDLEGNLSKVEQTVDGITLSVTSSSSEDGQTTAKITLKVGPNSYSGYIKLDGNVDVSGQLSADALYAALGDIADLTVDRLSTSRRIVKYLAGDQSDDNFVRIREQYLEFVSGVCEGGREQAENPNGALLYWEADPAGASIGSDGYPYVDGERIFTTTTVTDWPVMVYKYEELVKRSIAFEQQGDQYVPVDVFGAGDSSGRQRGTLIKDTDGLLLAYQSQGGKDLGLHMGDGGYTDIYGLRKTTGLNFSEWSSGHFYERIDGDDTRYAYNVEFDGQGRPTKITDSDGHSMSIYW